jgi:gliding motility-associated-like protein
VQLIRTNTSTGCSDTSLVSVNLKDSIAPQTSNCLQEYHVEALYTENELYYIFSNSDKQIIPTATDNCPINSLIYSFNYNESDYHELSEFQGFKITNNGQNQIKWTISDRSGNATTCATTIYFDTNRIVPSAFSPNGDLMNDVWNIKFLKQYPNCIVKVFNRWGIAVYESEKGYQVSWDGRRNGELVPVDSYYYVITMGDGSASMQGHVTVLY